MLSEAQEQPQQSPYKLCVQPDWVTRKARPAPDEDAHPSPQKYLLLDYQTLVDEAGNHSYQRLCYQVNDASCIENMSQFLYNVRPESQSISFHSCVIYRDDKTIDCLDPDNMRCMQRELQLERHVSSDMLTIEFIIDDLRTGDIVDIETTYHDLKAEHPLHGFYIREEWSLAWGRPVAHQVIRVINHSSANLVVQHIDSENEKNDLLTIGQCSEYEKEWTDLPRTSNTGNLTPEYWPPKLIATTETSWSEVSTHLYQAYHQAGIFDPVDIADLELSNVTEESLIRNIRFIQNNIRYRSESSGIFTHTPKLPSQTLKKRAGDCKDKSTLLLSVLKAMGIEAHLALVHTCLRDAIQTVSPSPFLFDHMIVHFAWQGKSYFVDATIQKQGGTLATMAQLPYKCALLLKPQGGTLTAIPYSTDSIVYRLIQTFDLSLSRQSKPVVTYQREYNGARADNIRQYFSSNELAATQKSYHEGLADQLGATLTPVKDMHIVTDDIKSNYLTTEESYLIETPLSEIDDGTLVLVTPFYQDLEISNSVTTPEQLFPDGELQQEILIKYHCKSTANDNSFKCDNAWFEYSETMKATGNTLHFKAHLRPKSNRVEADQRQEYVRQVDVLKNRCSTHFPSVVKSRLKLGLIYFAITVAIFAIVLATRATQVPAGVYIIGGYLVYWLFFRKARTWLFLRARKWSLFSQKNP